MNECNWVCSRLSAHVDQDLPMAERSRVLEHLAICVPCQHEEQAMLDTIRTLQTLSARPTTPAERAGILAAVAASAASARTEALQGGAESVPPATPSIDLGAQRHRGVAGSHWLSGFVGAAAAAVVMVTLQSTPSAGSEVHTSEAGSSANATAMASPDERVVPEVPQLASQDDAASRRLPPKLAPRTGSKTASKTASNRVASPSLLATGEALPWDSSSSPRRPIDVSPADVSIGDVSLADGSIGDVSIGAPASSSKVSALESGASEDGVSANASAGAFAVSLRRAAEAYGEALGHGLAVLWVTAKREGERASRDAPAGLVPTGAPPSKARLSRPDAVDGALAGDPRITAPEATSSDDPEGPSRAVAKAAVPLARTELMGSSAQRSTRGARIEILRSDSSIRLRARGAVDELVPALLSGLQNDDQQVAALVERRLLAIHERAQEDPRLAEALLAPPFAERERLDGPPGARAATWQQWWLANADQIVRLHGP